MLEPDGLLPKKNDYTPNFNRKNEPQNDDETVTHNKAVIFDCDGVLVDTEILKYKAWAEVFKPYDITITLDDYMPWVGFSSTEIIDGLLSGKGKTADELKINKSKLRDLKNTIYEDIQKKGVEPIPHAVAFLKDLLKNKQQYKIKVALASSATHPQINESLTQIGVDPKDFDAIISGNADSQDLAMYTDTQKNKPKPYIYQETAKRLGLEPYECIVLEDSEAGVVSAADAGMPVIALPNDFTKNHNFDRATAISDLHDMTLSKLRELAVQKGKILRC